LARRASTPRIDEDIIISAASTAPRRPTMASAHQQVASTVPIAPINDGSR
jgi:hypothetical protein